MDCISAGGLAVARVDGGELTLLGDAAPIPAAAVARSEVLQTLLTDTDCIADVLLPVSAELLRSWIGAITAAQPEFHMQQLSARDLMNILTAADALADRGAVTAVCIAQRPVMRRALGMLTDVEEWPAMLRVRALHVSPSPTTTATNDCPMTPEWVAQVLSQLSPDLAITLLRAAITPPGPGPLGAEPAPIYIPPELFALPPHLSVISMHACAPCIAADLSVALLYRDDSAVRFAASALPSLQALTSLEFRFHPLCRDAKCFQRLLQAACCLPSLRSLRIDNAPICSERMNAIASSIPHATGLRTLALSHVRFDVAGAGNLSVALLKLNRGGDGGCGPPPGIQRLEFIGCFLTEDHVKIIQRAMRDMFTLQALHVNEMNVSDTAVASLVAAGAHLLQFRTLILHRITHVPNACGHEALARAIGSVKSLCDLELVQYGVGARRLPGLGEVLEQHLSHCAQLTRLDLSDSLDALHMEAIGRLLYTLRGLRHLALCHVPSGDDLGWCDLVRGIAGLAALTHLDLTCVRIPSSAISVAPLFSAQHSVLQVLKLHAGGFTGGGDIGSPAKVAAAVGALCAMRALTLGGVGSGSAWAWAKAAATATALKRLDLNGCQLGQEGLQGFRRGFLQGWEARVVDGAHGEQHIRACRLQALDLTMNCIDADGLRRLEPVLRNLGMLTELLLSDNALGQEGAQVLAGVGSGSEGSSGEDGLVGLKKLCLLGLSHCSLGAGGLRALVPALETLPDLRELRIRGKRFTGDSDAIEALRESTPQLYVAT